MTNDKPWLFQKGQTPHNAGKGGCRRGHDPSRYRAGTDGVKICLDCKRENGAKYRATHKERLSWVRRVQPYGITVLELDAIFNKHQGACGICRAVFYDGNYHIDHDHESGKVRGLLCASCNTGIGLFKDSPARLQSAIEYLHGRISHPTPQAPLKARIIYQLNSASEGH